MYYYFFTLDKVRLNGAPTKEELTEVYRDLYIRTGLKSIRPIPVRCYESKAKGLINYLHYHELVVSHNCFIRYTSLKRKGYSVKLERLKTSIDVVRVAGYICKQKTDNVDIKIFQPKE